MWPILGEESIRCSERHCLVGGQLVRLADEVVARAQASDEPSFLVERALPRQHANRHGAARTIVGQSGIMAMAPCVLPTPELLVSSPGLKMACEGVVQPASMRFADVDDGIRSIALPLADQIHARLAAQRSDPFRISASRADRAVAQARVPQIAILCRDTSVTVAYVSVGVPRREVDDRRRSPAGDKPWPDASRHGTRPPLLSLIH